MDIFTRWVQKANDLILKVLDKTDSCLDSKQILSTSVDKEAEKAWKAAQKNRDSLANLAILGALAVGAINLVGFSFQKVRLGSLLVNLYVAAEICVITPLVKNFFNRMIAIPFYYNFENPDLSLDEKQKMNETLESSKQVLWNVVKSGSISGQIYKRISKEFK